MIENAVVPVAGLGTRLLPISKSLPKEMLPVGRKPVVQHVVEELYAAGISNVLFVTSGRKQAIENLFDRDSELIERLVNSGKDKLAAEIDLTRLAMRFYYIRQAEQNGLGHAITFARGFSDQKPFAVALGDSLIESDESPNLMSRLMDCFESRKASAVIALDEVPEHDIPRYGIAKPAASATGDVLLLDDLIEKPSIANAPSNLAIAARYVFSPEIFDALDRTAKGCGGEYQLTDAIRILLQDGKKVYGVRLNGLARRHDIGTYASYYRCFIDYALSDPEFGDDLREYLEQVLAREHKAVID